jgi:hypothetical protein
MEGLKVNMTQHLYHWERASEPTVEENWVGPSAGLDGYGKEKTPLPLPAFEPWTI